MKQYGTLLFRFAIAIGRYGLRHMPKDLGGASQDRIGYRLRVAATRARIRPRVWYLLGDGVRMPRPSALSR
jgi:hypothetical protein